MDSKADPTPRFLTIEQVSEELNVGAPAIRSLLKTGELRGIQIGGRGIWRISREDLEAYVQGAYEKTAERVASGDQALDSTIDPNEETQ